MNQLIKQICAEAGMIEGILDKAKDPEALDTSVFKTVSPGLLTLLEKVNQKPLELERQEQGLKKSIEELLGAIEKTEIEISTLEEKCLERYSELDALREIVRQLDLPETKEKSAQVDRLRQDVQQLSEEKERLDKEIAPLQEEKNQYEGLNREINESVANMQIEEVRIIELNEKIADSNEIIEGIRDNDLPQKENQKNRILLYALRLAIKAKQKNMYTPGWDRLIMLLELDTAKEDSQSGTQN